MSQKDVTRLTNVLGKHQHYTGSKKAAELRAEPQDIPKKFKKVAPVGYEEARKKAGMEEE